jgi:aspartate/methionine/tyrosine aminotransferase
VIADEVFIDYPADPAEGAAPAPRRAASILSGPGAAPAETLAFVLGGLSKSCGLPQLKLGWIAVAGPSDAAAGAMQRLELVADTYLSVATPVQKAAARLLDLGEGICAAIRARLAGNRTCLRRLVPRGSSCQVLDADGGWYAVLRVPAVRPEEDLVVALLQQDGVLVHPGYFFDFPGEAYLVLSLLSPPAEFGEALGRILRRAG